MVNDAVNLIAGRKNYFQDPSGLLIARRTHQGRLDTGRGESN